MKRSGKVLVAVAMMVGSLGAVGCNSNAQSADAVAPEESVASAPVENDSATTTTSASNAFGVELGLGFRRDAPRFHYYAPHAPPVVRYEVIGRAPSARHFWAPGYWRWNGREYIWVGGRWELRRDGYEYVSPRWNVVRSHGRYEYIPGHWVRRW